MTLSQIFHDCAKIMPEIALAAFVCIVILADVIMPKGSAKWVGWIALAGLGLALFAVAVTYGNHYHSVFIMRGPTVARGVESADPIIGPDYCFSRMLVIDKLSDFFKVVFLLGTIGVVVFSMRSAELKDYRPGEYYALMLSTVLSGMFLVSSNNFLMLVLSLETLSLCSYVLAGYVKHNRLSAEASLKYILYGSVASGVMLFGISYIYGMAGTLDIKQSLFGIAMREDNALAVQLAFVLVIGGLGFKMAAVPFHFWCPDVYQGAPTPVTAFLAVVSKAAGFSALFRALLPLFAVEGSVIPDSVLAVRGSLLAVIQRGHLPLLFWVLSVATMTLGNLVAIRQTDLKRLLAYSSIAHAGYILMAMTVFNNGALEAMLFYFFVYLFMNLGAFLVVIMMINQTGRSDMESYRGVAWTNPFLFVMMFLFLISLTGIPPTAGFLGKLELFKVVVGAGNSALDHGAMTGTAMFYYSLAIIGAINSAISLYYYMNIVKAMVFSEPKDAKPVPVAFFDRLNLLVYAAPVLLLIVNFAPALSLVQLFQR